MSRRLTRVIIDLALRRIRAGRLVLIEGERRRSYGTGTPIATVLVHSPRTWPMLLRGSLGLADAYAQGLWDTPDLVALIRLAARNGATMDRARERLGRWSVPSSWRERCGDRALAGAGDGTSPPTTTSGTSCSAACSIRP